MFQPLYAHLQYMITVGLKIFPKVVINEHIKYIIPIDYKHNVIMISYTDGKYAKYWKKTIDNKEQINQLNIQLKKLFPDLKIGKIKQIYNYYWDQGAIIGNLI